MHVSQSFSHFSRVGGMITLIIIIIIIYHLIVFYIIVINGQPQNAKMKKCMLMNLRNTQDVLELRAQGIVSCGHLRGRGKGEAAVKKTEPSTSLLAILIPRPLCKGAPGDSDGLPSLETGPFKTP